MTAGEFRGRAHVLRAKIDMASPNINMRDPALYRIRRRRTTAPASSGASTRCTTSRTPSDAIEHITHSICTLEFEDHRPLYDWVLDNLPVPSRPQQIEFARLNLNYTVLSKRKLLTLVTEKHVSGWDDPRMPTIAGLRRRGYPPEAIRAFCDAIGVAKRDSIVDVAMLEHAVRDELNRTAPRAMAVLQAAQGRDRELPGRAGRGGRRDQQSRGRVDGHAQGAVLARSSTSSRTTSARIRQAVLPPLAGREVRLRYAYFIRARA
jgi:glutaminyl-tRNA synthetase